MNAAHALARSYAALHPSEVARLGDAEASGLPALLDVLSAEAAASVLRASSVHSASRSLPRLRPEHVQQIVGVLGLPAASVLVSHLSKDDRETVCRTLTTTDAEQLRRLSERDPDSAAGAIETEVVTVLQTRSVGEALAEVRSNAGSARYYVYVLAEGQKLVGVVNLRQLFSAPQGQLVGDLMTPDPDRLHASDRRAVVLKHPGWRRHPMLPVVDDEGRFLGAIGYARFRSLQAEVGDSLGHASGAQTASHLAEVYALGASALLRWGSIAIAEGSDDP